MNKYIVPTMKEIMKDYNEIISILRKVKTHEDVLKLQKELKRDVYINEKSASKYKGQEIEVISLISWKTLYHIYYYPNNDVLRFDIWNDYLDIPFFDHEITMEGLKSAYELGVLNTLSYCNTPNELSNIRSALKEQGYSDYELKYTFALDHAVNEYEFEYSEIRRGIYTVKAETEEEAEQILLQMMKDKKAKEPEVVDRLILSNFEKNFHDENNRCEDCECLGDCLHCEDCECYEDLECDGDCENCDFGSEQNDCSEDYSDDNWCEDCKHYAECHEAKDVDDDEECDDISTPEEFMEFFMDFADYCAKNIMK